MFALGLTIARECMGMELLPSANWPQTMKYHNRTDKFIVNSEREVF